MKRTLTCAGAVIAIGLVAGITLGSGMALYCARSLPANCWILNFQALDALFGKAMSVFFLIALILLSTATLIASAKARAWFGIATLLLILAIAITLAGNVPINRLVDQMDAALPAENVTELRDL